MAGHGCCRAPWECPRRRRWLLRAKEALDAAQALACGLVSRVVPPDARLEQAMSLARKIAANPGGVLRMTKRLLREGERSSLESLLELSAGYQAIAHMTPDHHGAVRAFVEKRAPKFSG